MGRPSKDIDKAQVLKLARMCFKVDEIAYILAKPVEALAGYNDRINQLYPPEEEFIKIRASRLHRALDKEDKRKSRYLIKKILRELFGRSDNDIANLLYCSLRSGLKESLEQQGIYVKALGVRALEFMIGYKLDELRKHLESQFTEGMSWENHGEWHIDHIKPKSWFNFQTAQDKEFLECWGIENLQPKWAKDNLSKGNRKSG